MAEIIHNSEQQPSRLTIRDLAREVMALAEAFPEHTELLSEGAKKIEQLDRLNTLFGLLAPGGTAPRTALEELWRQSEHSKDESPTLLDLREMLAEHWADWTPALREIEGLPPRQN